MEHFIHKNAFERVVYGIAAILSRERWVKVSSQEHPLSLTGTWLFVQKFIQANNKETLCWESTDYCTHFY